MLKEIESIHTKEDFLEFITTLIQDSKTNKWDNNSLEEYLWGIEGFVDDMDGYFENKKDIKTLEKLKNNELDWKILAQILIAATVYE